MRDKPLAKEIGDLCKVLYRAGLKTTALLLDKHIGDRSLSEHKNADEKAHAKLQEKAMESLPEGIHSDPDKAGEVDPTVLNGIKDSVQAETTVPDAPESTELKFYQWLGLLIRDGQKILIQSPGALVSGLVALTENSIARAFAQELEPFLPQDAQAIVKRLKDELKDDWDLFRDDLFQLSCRSSIVYGVQCRALTAAGVYLEAGQFVERAVETRKTLYPRGACDPWIRMQAVTFASTSGIIDPLERYGRGELSKQLGLKEEAAKMEDVTAVVES